MPPSLLRPGRFDYVIYLQPPIGENAENIVSYYLRDKDLAEDVLISDIVKAMPKVSCATLETVMNLAALNSVYQGHEHIQKEDITEALLQVVYKLQKTDKETDSTELQKIAVHEAAHAVVGEVLHPGSIGIVTVCGSQGVIGGMANGCATYAQNEEEFLDEVTKTLAGRAGVSLIYGVMDIQASADIEQADAVCEAKQSTQLEIQRLAAMLPEYEVVMRMEGAGPVTGPALMAEIGDVRRFKNKKALVAFAGIDAPPFQSGAFESKSRHVSKRGSPHLRRTIFIVSNIILARSNPENAVYCFMDKKRSEGKHYYVYTVAGSAKFLRVYYARVTEFLRFQPSSDAC